MKCLRHRELKWIPREELAIHTIPKVSCTPAQEPLLSRSPRYRPRTPALGSHIYLASHPYTPVGISHMPLFAPCPSLCCSYPPGLATIHPPAPHILFTIITIPFRYLFQLAPSHLSSTRYGRTYHSPSAQLSAPHTQDGTTPSHTPPHHTPPSPHN